MDRVLKYTLKENQYYPTPAALTEDILYRMRRDFDDAMDIHFLEPCAGDGAICGVVKEKYGDRVTARSRV